MAEGKKRRSDRPKKVAEGVYRMPSGNLQLRWYAGTVNGKERTATKTIPGDTARAEAIRLRQRELEKVARARTSGVGDETIGGFAERWLRDYPRPAETTNEHNAAQVKTFVRDFGARKPETVTRTEAKLWASGGQAPAHLTKVVRQWHGVEEDADGNLVVPSHRNNVPAVRAMFTNIVEDERFDLDQNPFAGLRLKQERGRSDIVVLEPDELERLEAIARRLYGPVFAAMIRFAAWTGLRPSELYALRWRDIDFEEGVVKVRRQYRSKIKDPSRRETSYLKTDRGNRDVVLLQPAIEALESVPRSVSTDLIFTALAGEQMSARTHAYYWARVRPAFWETLDDDRKCPYCLKDREHDQHERGTIPSDFDFYELRHWFASYIAQLPGVTPMDVAEQMGHADGGKLAMERYFHIASRTARGRILRGYDRAQAEQDEDRRAAQ